MFAELGVCRRRSVGRSAFRTAAHCRILHAKFRCSSTQGGAPVSSGIRSTAGAAGPAVASSNMLEGVQQQLAAQRLGLCFLLFAFFLFFSP